MLKQLKSLFNHSNDSHNTIESEIQAAQLQAREDKLSFQAKIRQLNLNDSIADEQELIDEYLDFLRLISVDSEEELGIHIDWGWAKPIIAGLVKNYMNYISSYGMHPKVFYIENIDYLSALLNDSGREGSPFYLHGGKVYFLSAVVVFGNECKDLSFI